MRAVLDKGWMRLEEWMGGDAAVIRGARICYQSESTGPEADERLIRRLMASRPAHNTVFEHAVFRFAVKCPLFVARQWMRHRIACVAGDTLLYFDLPNAVRRGARCKYAVPVADLWRRWHEGTEHTIEKKKAPFLERIDPDQVYTIPELARSVERREETLREYVRDGRLEATRVVPDGPTSCAIMVSGRAWHDYASTHHMARVPMRERTMQMQLRMCNESSGEIEHTRIADIWASGPKPVFRVTLENGYQLKMTRDHLCLTERGWLSLEEATELRCGEGTVTWRADCPAFAINGQPTYTDAEWLAQRRAEGLGVQEIADLAGCSYHTVRKWLKRYGLQYSRSEISKLAGNRRRGRKRDRANPVFISEEHRQTLRALHSGPNSNFWKGGVSSERANIARWCTQHAAEVHARCDYRCAICGLTGGRLHAHHIDPVWHNKDQAMDMGNLVSLCSRCHRHIHHNDLELEFLDAYRAGRPLDELLSLPKRGLKDKPRPVPLRLQRSFSRVRHIEFVGVEPTYDIQVVGPYHNYVANGFVVHNSYNERSLRYCLADREYYVPEGHPEEREAYVRHMEASFDLYERLVAAGWRREQARGVLGLAVYTEFIWTVNAWSFMNWLEKRLDRGAQWEHRQYAEAALSILREVMPITAGAFEELVLKR